jgi:hypothetical protein
MLTGSGMANDYGFKEVFGCPEDETMTVRHVLKGSMCKPPTLNCRTNNCPTCATRQEELKEGILNVFEEYNIENVEYKKWTSTDRRICQQIIDGFNL